MPTLDELRTIIRDEVRAIVDPEGYRAGQERIRQNYMEQLENQLADFDLVERDKDLLDESRESVLTRMGGAILLLQRRIQDLDRALKLGQDGNHAARRRSRKR